MDLFDRCKYSVQFIHEDKVNKVTYFIESGIYVWHPPLLPLSLSDIVFLHKCFKHWYISPFMLDTVSSHECFKYCVFVHSTHWCFFTQMKFPMDTFYYHIYLCIYLFTSVRPGRESPVFFPCKPYETNCDLWIWLNKTIDWLVLITSIYLVFFRIESLELERTWREEVLS